MLLFTLVIAIVVNLLRGVLIATCVGTALIPGLTGPMLNWSLGHLWGQVAGNLRAPKEVVPDEFQ
jgi:hypothetical protein